MHLSSLLMTLPLLALAAVIGEPDASASLHRSAETTAKVRCPPPEPIDLRGFISRPSSGKLELLSYTVRDPALFVR